MILKSSCGQSSPPQPQPEIGRTAAYGSEPSGGGGHTISPWEKRRQQQEAQ